MKDHYLFNHVNCSETQKYLLFGGKYYQTGGFVLNAIEYDMLHTKISTMIMRCINIEESKNQPIICAISGCTMLVTTEQHN